MVPQYRAPPPDVQVIRWQLDPPTQMLAMQTPSLGQAPHSSEPPLQPLPILPQYWPPAGVQVTEGVQAASLPPSVAITIVPPAPVVPALPFDPPPAAEPPAPVPPPAPALPTGEPGITFAVQPSDVARTAASTHNPSRRIGTILGCRPGPKRLCRGPDGPFSAGKAGLSP